MTTTKRFPSREMTEEEKIRWLGGGLILFSGPRPQKALRSKTGGKPAAESQNKGHKDDIATEEVKDR